MNSYDIGDVVRCAGPFRDSAGSAADPTAVKFIYRNPAGTSTTLVYGTDAEVIRDSAGNYHVDISIPRLAASSGIWFYRWESTGNYQAADQDRPFFVRGSHFVTA